MDRGLPATRLGRRAVTEPRRIPGAAALIERAHPFAHRRLPVSVAGAEAERLGHRLLGAERPFETTLELDW
jgi:hypothetical protein